MKNLPARLALSLALVFVLTPLVKSQGLVEAPRARTALSTLPDSQVVLYVDVQRLIREALPRVLTADALERFLSEPRKVGINPQDFDYAVVGVRFGETISTKQVPDFVLVVKGHGTFNADTLLTMGRLAAGTQGIKPVQETYNSKTLDIVRFDSAPADGDAKPKPNSFPIKEVAATALDSGTLIIGAPAYVRTAIDLNAGASAGGLNAGLLDLATRNPTALWSLAAIVPTSLVEQAHQMGVPRNEEVDRIIGWLRQVGLSAGMTPVDFNLQAAVQTDTPEHASALSGMVAMGLTALQTQLEGKPQGAGGQKPEEQLALRALRSFTNTTAGNLLLLGTAIPQQAVAQMLKRQTPPATTQPAAPARQAPPRARTRRRATRRP